VNQSAAELAELGRAATSLRIASGAAVHRGLLLLGCLERLNGWLAIEAGARASALREAWQARLWGLGRDLLLRDGGEEFHATIEAVDVDGALVVRRLDGSRRRIVAGEIVLDEASSP
jgi:BirA family transcriptional regulator, biotin operon repressor / biotin---[acetyl-CoA-carboxylase] ligase